MNETIINIIHSALKDDHGVSETTIDAIHLLYQQSLGTPLANKLKGILETVDATDGRFYVCQPPIG